MRRPNSYGLLGVIAAALAAGGISGGSALEDRRSSTAGRPGSRKFKQRNRCTPRPTIVRNPKVAANVNMMWEKHHGNQSASV